MLVAKIINHSLNLITILRIKDKIKFQWITIIMEKYVP